MIEKSDFDTFLYISKNEYQIFVYDKVNFQSLYNKRLKINSDVNLDDLSKFLDDNIYKIEKIVGNFIRNIILIIEDNKILSINISLLMSFTTIQIEIEAEPGELGLATRYARMLTRNEDIPDGMVDALKAAFGIEGFVDMTVMIGYYGMLARFINTVKIPIEPEYEIPPFIV